MKTYTLRTSSGHITTQVANSSAEARRLVGIKGAVVTGWHTENMVSAEFYREVQQERDALRAHVKRLRDGLDKWHGVTDYSDGIVSRRYPSWVADLLEETPEQSLTHILKEQAL